MQGIDPRPYATSIRYWCPRNGWGFPSNGEWSNLDTIEQCEKLSYPRRLVAGGWLLVAGCAAADLVPAAPVEPGRGLDTGTIPPTYWGMVGANTGDCGTDTAPVLS